MIVNVICMKMAFPVFQGKSMTLQRRNGSARHLLLELTGSLARAKIAKNTDR